MISNDNNNNNYNSNTVIMINFIRKLVHAEIHN